MVFSTGKVWKNLGWIQYTKNGTFLRHFTNLQFLKLKINTLHIVFKVYQIVSEIYIYYCIEILKKGVQQQIFMLKVSFG